MQPFTACNALFLFLISLIFFADLTSSVSFNTTLPNCNLTFSCGNLKDISYPFTGGQRPAYCGLPDLHLTCLHESTTILEADSLYYQVTELDQTNQILTLIRSDLQDSVCTDQLANTTFNTTIFTPSSNDQILTLFYGCDDSGITTKPENWFSCGIKGMLKSSYYIIGQVTHDPIIDLLHCNTSLSVPVLGTWVNELGVDRSLPGAAVKTGFNMSYKDPYGDDCDKCLKSGGLCGFDSELSKSICICGDHLCQESSSNQTPMAVGLSVAGAVIAGICLGAWFLLVYQRRKRRRLAAKTESIEHPTPLYSNKDITTTATTLTILSQSDPSYPSSKSEVGVGSTYFGVQVFRYSELEEATENFDRAKELGDGGFGAVYYGVLRDGRVVAVKRLYENNMRRAEQFMNEIQILAHLRHPNLVTLYGCTSRHSRELLLVYEYISNGTVADHLHGKQSNSGSLTWPVRLSIARETAEALTYLHSSDVIHRDVKTNNILLDDKFCVKVADFGLSRLFPNDVTHVSTAPQGTPGYVDPEYYQCYQLTDKSDVYSFGVVLVELISSLQAVDTNRHRLDINLASMAITKIQNHQLNELVDPSLGFKTDYSVRRAATSVAELAFRCLQQEREMRPTMEEVLRALERIEKEYYGSEKAEVLEIRDDDISLLKHMPPDFSSDSLVLAPDKWAKEIRSI